MIPLFFAGTVGLLFVLHLDRGRASVYSLAAVLVTTVLYAKLLSSPGPFRHVGIAGSKPALTTFALVFIVLFVFAVPGMSRLSDFMIPGPLLLWVALGALLYWPQTPEIIAGVCQYGIAIVAWAVGMRISRDLARNPALVKAASAVVSGVLAAELVVVAAQYVGIPINPMEAAQVEILSGRLNGTMGHPNDLGKVTLLLVALLLGLSRTSDKRIRITNRFAVGAGLAIAVATEGRVVIASMVALIFVWGLVQPREEAPFSRRLAILSVGAMGAIASASVVIARFAEDPTGGVRSTTREVAREQISSNWFPGIGPNSYVSTVGARDSLTAGGVPVHDTTLLVFAELGVVGLICLFVPLLWILFRAVVRRGTLGLPGSFATALVAMTPGLIMIGATGWGILGGSIFPLTLFVLGFLYSPVAANSTLTERHLESAKAGRPRS